jgi:hypothetical protein
VNAAVIEQFSAVANSAAQAAKIDECDKGGPELKLLQVASL